MRLFKCQSCRQVLYFENIVCERCKHALGFIPEVMTLAALEDGGTAWHSLTKPTRAYRYCANGQYGVCNWLIEADSPDQYCLACRHNRTVPDTSVPGNVDAWRKIEAAKHRLFYSLKKLRLPLDQYQPDGRPQLCFDFLASVAPHEGLRVMTGHDNGLITLALEEADDAEREKRRTNMHEPYRTVLGHFRHEVGHYYWDVLVRDGGQLDRFRAVFGDETEDYGAALSTYYANGPKLDWPATFISAYASSHPWEDFAETWAHYLHIVDTLEMAAAFGLHLDPPVARPGELDAEVDFDPYRAKDHNALIAAWIPISTALNCLNQAMGLLEPYPFVLTPTIVEKLGFIHALVHGMLERQKLAS